MSGSAKTVICFNSRLREIMDGESLEYFRENKEWIRLDRHRTFARRRQHEDLSFMHIAENKRRKVIDSMQDPASQEAAKYDSEYDTARYVQTYPADSEEFQIALKADLGNLLNCVINLTLCLIRGYSLSAKTYARRALQLQPRATVDDLALLVNNDRYNFVFFDTTREDRLELETYYYSEWIGANWSEDECDDSNDSVDEEEWRRLKVDKSDELDSSLH